MVYILLCLLLCALHDVQSFNLTSLGNATIPTKIEHLQIDNLKYEKAVKDISGNVSLRYQLENIGTAEISSVELLINNKTVQNLKVIEKSETIPKGIKVYIMKETEGNSIYYNVKFPKIEDATSGVYVLRVESSQAISFIFSPPIVATFPKPKLGLEGDPMRLTCSLEGYPPPTAIIWERLEGNVSLSNKTEIVSDDRIEFTKGKDSKYDNDTIHIRSLIKNDSGFYLCRVKSPIGEDCSVIKVNVKDRWAALYPFIGIVIEVILLVTAILAYEKYQIRSQNKKNYGGENIDEDNKEPGIPLASGGGDDDNTVADNDLRSPPPPVEVDVEKSNNIDGSKQREIATTKNV